MASIEKRSDFTYRITVDYIDEFGKPKRERKTVKTQPGLTKKAIEKILEKEKVLFEDEIRNRKSNKDRVKIKEFIETWKKEYVETSVSQKTQDQYAFLLKRISENLGDIPIGDLNAFHIEKFYNILRKEEERADTKYCCNQKTDLKQLILSKYPTLVEFSKKSGLNENTLRSAIQKNNVSPATAKKIADTLDVELSDIFDEIKKGALSEHTIHHYHICLSAMLNKAVKWKYINNSPIIDVDAPKVRSKEIEVFDIDETLKMLNLVEKENAKYSTAINLIIHTGMRREEALGLKWSDINFNENIITISRALKYSPKKGLFDEAPKTEKSKRQIPVSGDVLNTLKSFKTYQDSLTEKFGDARKKSEFIFTNENGSNIRPDTLTNWFIKFRKKNELRNVGIHGLRHTYASLMIENDTPITTLSSLIGHTRNSTTFDYYGHSMSQSEKRAAETINKILKKR